MKLLKIFLILTATALASALLFWLVIRVFGWAWWVALSILLGIAGLWLGIIFFIGIWRIHRDQHFVEQIIEQEDAYAQTLGEQEKDNLKELQANWKEAIDALKLSPHLRRMGNPLYALPWYLIIGESASGKTTAIKSARLASFSDDLRRISGTRNFGWWFSERAIIIDTAGRYSIRVDEGQDKKEWQKFLLLLSKYRKKEPLNGLILTITAEKLLTTADPEELKDDGRILRHRADELMRILRVTFPVYVLVTKCDLIQGMTEFSDHLPDKGLDQAMGMVNNNFSAKPDVLTERSLHTMGDHLRDLRLILLNKPGTKEVDPKLLLFPEEFESMKPGLTAFIEGTFQEHPLRESPVLRGIFFSSGHQEGRPFSQFLNALGLTSEKENLPATDKGIFLHDFFANILPKDRELFPYTPTYTKDISLTKYIGLASAAAIIIALCGLMVFSFVRNRGLLNEASQKLSTCSAISQEGKGTEKQADCLRKAVSALESGNRGWWHPRMGLHTSELVEERLKKEYCKQVKNDLLIPFDKQLTKNMAENMFDKTALSEHIDHLLGRILLLRSRLDNKSLDALLEIRGEYQPFHKTVIPEQATEISDSLYPYYLTWQQDANVIEKERDDLINLLLQSGSLNWLVDWANGDPALSALTLKEFWGDSLSGDGSMIPPAFTVKGKEKIDTFLKELTPILPDKSLIKKFRKWYRNAYLSHWQDFVAAFPGGQEMLNGKSEWLKIAEKMDSEKGPYFSLLDRMGDELEPVFPEKTDELLRRDDDLPTWVQLLYQLEAAKVELVKASDPDKSKKQSAIRALLPRLASKLTRMRRIAPLVGTGNKKSLIAGGKAFQEYQEALTRITKEVRFKNKLYEMTRDVFDEKPSPFFVARSAFRKYEDAMMRSKHDASFEKLLIGPLDFLWAFARQETACHVQKMWKKEIFFTSMGNSDPERIRAFFGEDGAVVRFFGKRGTAAPFIEVKLVNEYAAKELHGDFKGKLPFTEPFFTFYAEGKRGVPRVEAHEDQLRKYEADMIRYEQDRRTYERELDKYNQDMERYRQEYEAYKNALAMHKRELEIYDRQVSQSQMSKPPKPSEYHVTIRALPSKTNSEAQTIPIGTYFELQCPGGSVVLKDYNLFIQKDFQWTEDCGDIIFRIMVKENLVLRKRYKGRRALDRFFNDFRMGQHTFEPKDFPEKHAELEHLRIKYITVKYELDRREKQTASSGAESSPEPLLLQKPPIGEPPRPPIKPRRPREPRKPVKPVATVKAPQIPRDIIKCWE